MTTYHQKLNDAAARLQALESPQTFTAYRLEFAGILSDLRSVVWAIEQDVKRHLKGHQRDRLPAFVKWLKEAHKLINSDPLLSWIKCARDDDIHTRQNPAGLGVAEYKVSLHTNDFPPPHPEATLDVGLDGPFWVLPGSPPRRIPVRGTDSEWTIYVLNPPSTHLGQQITDLTPPGLCRLAIEYYDLLVAEVDRDWMT